MLHFDELAKFGCVKTNKGGSFSLVLADASHLTCRPRGQMSPNSRLMLKLPLPPNDGLLQMDATFYCRSHEFVNCVSAGGWR